MAIGTHSEAHVQLVNDYIHTSFKQFAETVSEQFAPLVEAMRYSMEGSAKRLRPTLMLAAGEYLEIDPKRLLSAACGLEMIHAYSLVHDDLPALDDDDLRRGRPASHKKFGEDVAILAGDALLTEAFGQFLKLRDHGFDADKVLDVIGCMVHHAGVGGMVGGQLLDVTSPHEITNIPELEFIHIHKTGGLIVSSVCIPAKLIGAPEDKLKSLRLYGEALGLAFQISDDLLDAETNGRYSRGPRKKPKPCYTQLMSPTEARDRLNGLVDTALRAVGEDNAKAQTLVEIAKFIRIRKH